MKTLDYMENTVARGIPGLPLQPGAAVVWVFPDCTLSLPQLSSPLLDIL